MIGEWSAVFLSSSLFPLSLSLCFVVCGPVTSAPCSLDSNCLRGYPCAATGIISALRYRKFNLPTMHSVHEISFQNFVQKLACRATCFCNNSRNYGFVHDKMGNSGSVCLHPKVWDHPTDIRVGVKLGNAEVRILVSGVISLGSQSVGISLVQYLKWMYVLVSCSCLEINLCRSLS